MPVITIDEASIDHVVEILQQGVYKELSYKSIQQTPGCEKTIGSKNIIIIPSVNDPSISFLVDSENEQATKENGWKFQISIDDSLTAQQPPHKANLEIGFNRVKEILLRHKVPYFKVVNDATDSDTNTIRKDYEKGKQITIYTLYSRNIDWPVVLRDITIALLLPPAIQTSVVPINCRAYTKTLGRQFISYRNDFNPKDSKNPINDNTSIYIAAQNSTHAYNPYGYPDPFEDIRLNISEETALYLQQNPTLASKLQQIDFSLRERNSSAPNF